MSSCHATGHSKEVLQCTVRAGEYFAGNFSRGKECELNIPSEKYIRVIDLSAELPECWMNLPPQTYSIQFNLTFGHFHMNRYGVYRTGKNNRFPILDILGYLKNSHKNPKFGKVRQVPIREFNQVPWLGLVSLFQIWDFCGYSLNTIKYPKMGICYFFPVTSV